MKGVYTKHVRISGFVIMVLSIAITQALEDSIDDSSSGTIGDDTDWNSFKERFKKSYKSPEEENFRRAVRAQNMEAIKRHNIEAAAGKYRFTLAENSLVDLTPPEYNKFLGYRSSSRSSSVDDAPVMPVYSLTTNVSELPTTVNWTTKGWVGPVENQGQCGSCWSYSAAGSLEAQYYNQTGQFVQLSEQNLIDCSWPEDNDGCNGGNMQNAFWYVQQNGIEPLSSYPDTSNVTGLSYTCAYNPSLIVMKVNSWRNVLEFSEPSLQQAVASVGPVSVAIDASSEQFQFYSGGVFSITSCSQLPADLDHAVLAVGYGVYSNEPYWLLQNSWGTSWGMNGYMMMARDADNMCGIATAATFPVAGWTTTDVTASSAPISKTDWTSVIFIIATLLNSMMAISPSTMFSFFC